MTRRRARARRPVLVDAAALQSPTSRGRGIAGYAEQWILALEAQRPDLVARYLLDPSLPPPEDAEELLASGKLAYRGATGEHFERARLFHTLSPLDTAVALETAWPQAAHDGGLLRSATVYDLIPALDPVHELADPVARRRYRTRLELLRAADQLQTLSAKVAGDLSAVLGVGAGRVVVVGAAPALRFRADATAAALAPAVGLLGGLERPFVLVPAGSHPRKNNERVLEAWARLPAPLRSTHRLVLTGAAAEPTARHYEHLAERGGFADGLVVAGAVSDEVLLACYRAARLVCFASLAEGYGLPVAEAVACGTPVIASDVAPLDELLEPVARFDPTRPAAIAAAISAALGEPGRLEMLRGAAHRLATPAEVAERVAAAFDGLLAARRRLPPRPLREATLAGALPAGNGRAPGATTGAPGRPGGGDRRPRLAFASPFPPAPSGVAAYSYRLVEELLATGAVKVDAYFDGPTPGQLPPPGAAVHRAAALPSVERLLGRYDAVCYAVGNSHHHLGALSSLRERAGAVVAHDVRLTNCYRAELGDPALEPGTLARAAAAMYSAGGPAPAAVYGAGGAAPAGARRGEGIEPAGLLMAREAIAHASVYLTSSPAAVELAAIDARPGDEAKIRLLPFAVEDPGTHQAPFAAAGTRAAAPELDGDSPLVVHFGIVDPVKLPGVLLEAVAALVPRHPGLRCAFVGPIGPGIARWLGELAAELGCAGALVMTGPLAPAAYRSALDRATLAVQLRGAFNGEASAAVGECLACGVPTVVSRLGWTRSLPADSVAFVEPPVTATALAGLLDGLLASPQRRQELSEAARQEAARRSFAATARALLEILFGEPATSGARSVPAGARRRAARSAPAQAS